MSNSEKIAQLESRLASLREARAEVARDIRNANRREQAKADKRKRIEDRNEAFALLDAMRKFGIPNGKSVEFLETISTYPFDANNPELFAHIVETFKEKQCV